MGFSYEYQELCRIRLEHGYYDSLFPEGRLNLEINKKNKTICRNYNYLVRIKGSEILILFESSSMEQNEIALEHEPPRLTIGIRIDDPVFFNLTAGEVIRPGYLLVFDTHDARVESEAADLEDITTAILHREKMVTSDYLKKNEQIELAQRAPSLEVTLNPELMIRGITNKEYHRTQYSIRFATRELLWQYWVWIPDATLKKLMGDLDNHDRLLIETDDTSIVFNQESERHRAGHRTAFKFLSSHPLKITAKAPYVFALIYRNGLTDKVLITHLPNPGSDQLELIQQGQKTVLIASIHVSV